MEVSGEGVQSRAAISHLKHILPTDIHHDIIMTSPSVPTDGPLLFQRTDNHTRTTPRLETQHLFHGTKPIQSSKNISNDTKTHTARSSLRAVHSEPCESFV